MYFTDQCFLFLSCTGVVVEGEGYPVPVAMSATLVIESVGMDEWI